MWVFTRYGFFSIACASKPDGTLNHDQVMIRARRDAHLQALQYRFPQLREYKSLVFDNRDYRYRLIIPKDVWIDVLTGIAREQEWSNFKDEAGRFQGSKGEDYLKVLSRIWTITRELQYPTRPNTIRHVGISDEAALLAERLATAAKTVCGRHQAEIDEMKQKSLAFWQAEDFIWESLLLSAATLGRAKGARLVREKEFHDEIRFSVLAALTPTERLATLKRVLRAAKLVRMPDQKAERLAQNFDLIQHRGGPEAVKQELINAPGREGKIEFMKQFAGIGKKYARNSMMDAYHPDFREGSIALDSRLQGLLKAVGKPGTGDYEDSEDFLLKVAEIAGIEAWELDRLLFNKKWKDEVLELFRASAAHIRRN